jgi:hypothetical protein
LRAAGGDSSQGDAEVFSYLLLAPSGHKELFNVVPFLLNDDACWRNIPINIWNYTIGGYQVLKKWLSYREYKLLGRPLNIDEAREVTHIARRIAALLSIQPALDKNYNKVKAATAQFRREQL